MPFFVNNSEVDGKVWLFWAEEVDFELSSCSDQAISGWFSFGSRRLFASFVYASCFRDKRVELWEYLRLQNPQGLPWLVGGDFNIIRSDSEKVGGVFQAPRAKMAMDFNNCINDCALLDIHSKGNRLSWCNGRLGGRRIWARLDCILVNVQFLNEFEGAGLCYLPRTSSDHSPMVLNFSTQREQYMKPFRFLRIWGTHEGFLPLVKSCWDKAS
ncbi:uncharacterized protein LOC122296997 [Carya illinoinensis]|uniref:uncharacterized protein LOC122296997 n=1 Tax=Carya illinoinensis TaxID=32201 RepID=UPI001C72642B|nr:uncharacterized protein LOC122296997 [Carya illinoinensis]